MVLQDCNTEFLFETVLGEFVLIPQHTSPSNATKEIDELYDVFVAIKKKWRVEVGTVNVEIIYDISCSLTSFHWSGCVSGVEYNVPGWLQRRLWVFGKEEPQERPPLHWPVIHLADRGWSGYNSERINQLCLWSVIWHSPSVWENYIKWIRILALFVCCHTITITSIRKYMLIWSIAHWRRF